MFASILSTDYFNHDGASADNLGKFAEIARAMPRDGRYGRRNLCLYSCEVAPDELPRLVETINSFPPLGLVFSMNTFHTGWISEVCEGLLEDCKLREFQIIWCNIQNNEAKAIGLLLKHNSTLVALRLADTNITDISFLHSALKVNTTLKYLEIYTLDFAVHPVRNRTRAKTVGIKSLAKALATNVSLEDLRIGNQLLDDADAIALARALVKNRKLRCLVLNGTDIRNKGGIALAKSLTKNTSLRTLELNHSLVGNDTMVEFATTIGVGGNRTLRKLYFGLVSYGVNAEGLYPFEEALKVNREVEVLRIPEGNPYTAEGTARREIRRRIEQVLKERHEFRREAVMQVQSTEVAAPWLRSKLMVVGKGGVGKTNIVRSIIGLSLNPNWDSTVGINLTELVTTTDLEWKRDRGRPFAHTFVHRLAYENVEESKERMDDPPHPKGNRPKPEETDIETAPTTSTSSTALEPKKKFIVPTREGPLDKIQYWDYTFKEQEEVKNSINMSVWDYGGQQVFYTLHHLFLTQYGIYLVLFNMTVLLDKPEESLRHIKFWLNSTKLHAPNAPVILVGTFLDELTDNLSKRQVKAKLKSISKTLEKVTDGFHQVHKFEEWVYCPTSNKDKSGIQSLRTTIESEARKQDFVYTPVSLKWMRALDILGKSDWMKVSVLKVQLQSIGIDREEEMERMLCLFHELGVVLYFSSSIRLKEVVISKPQWLLQHLSLVIRDKDVHDYDVEKIHEIGLSQEFEIFLQSGIASRDLLSFFWNNSQVDYLIELMGHLLLLSDWNFSEEKQYLIPSMLSTTESPTRISGAQFYLKFVFLPQGVFERICCLCVSYSSSLQRSVLPQLSQTACIVDLGVNGILRINVKHDDSKIEVTVSKGTEASAMLAFFMSMMQRIQNEFMHGGLQWEAWVGAGDQFIPLEDAKVQLLEPWVKVEASQAEVAPIEKLLDV